MLLRGALAVSGSEWEQQEAGEEAEVPRVVVEPVAGRQAEANAVACLELERHAAGRGRVATMVVQVQAEDDRLVVPVQVETHVPLQVICGRKAEEVKSSDRSGEDT